MDFLITENYYPFYLIGGKQLEAILKSTLMLPFTISIILLQLLLKIPIIICMGTELDSFFFLTLFFFSSTVTPLFFFSFSFFPTLSHTPLSLSLSLLHSFLFSTLSPFLSSFLSPSLFLPLFLFPQSSPIYIYVNPVFLVKFS